jgi:hypothetical protein
MAGNFSQDFSEENFPGRARMAFSQAGEGTAQEEHG